MDQERKAGELPEREIILTSSDGYEDRFGNRVVGRIDHVTVKFKKRNSVLYVGKNCRFENCTIVFNGTDSKLVLGEGGFFKDMTVIFNGESGTIKIGANAQIREKTEFKVEERSCLSIGENCIWRHDAMVYSGFWSEIWIGSHCIFNSETIISSARHACCKIGDHVTAGRNVLLAASDYTKLHIGKDCMLSGNIMIMPGNGHAMFDVRSGEAISVKRGNKILLHEHVWVGGNVTIFGNVEVGQGSVIGISSFLKDSCFPNNCSLAGRPATILKKDVAWSRDADTFSCIPEREQKYWRLTGGTEEESRKDETFIG